MDELLKSLAEQLQITRREIQQRKELLGLNADDEQLLKQYKPMFAKYLDGIVKNFYDKQIQFNEIAKLIGDSETLRRLKSAMRRYILELFDGVYDLEYVNRRLRIGKIHQRIGVSSKLFLAAVHQLTEVLMQTIELHEYGKKEFKDALQLKRAVKKLLMFDTQLVLDTYIFSLVSEVELTREELRHYADNLEEEVAERTRQLEELSLRDMLTGIFNQRAFHEQLHREMAMAERFREQITLIYFDLNGFKKLNDTKGHLEGDELLSLIGQCMLKSVRETDVPCRYGGDEFAIILPRSLPEDGKMVAERLIKEFKANNTEKVSFSVGIVSTGPDEFDDMDSFVKRADTLMYKSKAKSKKRAGFYTSIEE